MNAIVIHNFVVELIRGISLSNVDIIIIMIIMVLFTYILSYRNIPA